MFSEIEKADIFKGIDRLELEKLFEQVTYRKRSFSKGEMAAMVGELCNDLIIVTEGSVRGEMFDPSGKAVTIDDIKAPQAVASIFLFGKKHELPVNIVANEPATLLYIPRQSVMRLFSMSPVFLQNYLDDMANRTHQLALKLRFLSFKTIKGKIAQFLLDQMKEPHVVEMAKTQQELAELFGVTRPSLARALGEMSEKGIIQAGRKKIIIPDVEKLKALKR
ncbi:MAG TPA: Crp/Fnr family transcriptional regulator [Bacteroidales bacterium]|nr:Crp/Fnr family transcriptional regulator [Bacteroidales bacterium]